MPEANIRPNPQQLSKKGTDYSVPIRNTLIAGHPSGVDRAVCPPFQQRMLRGVAARQGSMIRGRRDRKGNWSGLAILGIVGWSVTIPTLVGTAVGIWLDHHWPGRVPWTVTLLFGGLIFGCASAWSQLRGKGL